MRGLDSYENAPMDQLRMATRRALENMTQLAIDHAVDLVVIAGDLYDGDWPDQNTGLFFVGQARRLVDAGIRVAVIRGNHDAANRMTSELPLPTNPDGSGILLDEKKVDRRVFDDIGIAVHGRSYRVRAETSDMSADYPPPVRGLFNLGLLHTGLTGLDGHDPYAPCTPTQLADKGYDYWALGHIHLRGEHHSPGSAPIVFSGNVQGRHVRESGAKGCLLIDVDERGQCQSTFHPLDVVRWETCVVDASSIEHQDEMLDAFESWLAQTLPTIGDRLLVPRVRVEGVTSRHGQWLSHQDTIESALRASAISHGSGQVWMERLRIKTQLPDPSARPVGDPPDDDHHDVPLESILAVVAQLAADGETADNWVRGELVDLWKKLPPEFTQNANDLLGDDESSGNDGSIGQAWITTAAAELTGRLRGDR